MINRIVGESIAFTGGAEITPKVTVIQYYMPGSMTNSHKAFEIIQDSFGDGKPQRIVLSPQTMEAILKWGGHNIK